MNIGNSTRLSVIAFVLLAVCGCASGVDPILKVSDYRDESRERAGGNYCTVHKETELESSLSSDARISLLIPKDYWLAQQKYPFAKNLGEFFNGGPCVNLTLYCPDCERGMKRWLDDYWAKEEAASLRGTQSE